MGLLVHRGGVGDGEQLSPEVSRVISCHIELSLQGSNVSCLASIHLNTNGKVRLHGVLLPCKFQHTSGPEIYFCLVQKIEVSSEKAKYRYYGNYFK